MNISKKLKEKMKKGVLSVLAVCMVICFVVLGINKVEKNRSITSETLTNISKYESKSSSAADFSELFNVDEIIYIDANNGDDISGDGTGAKPYKTLDKLASSGIITQDKTYTVVLCGGSYNFTTSMLNLNCNQYVNIIGASVDTIVNVSTLYANSGRG